MQLCSLRRCTGGERLVRNARDSRPQTADTRTIQNVRYFRTRWAAYSIPVAAATVFKRAVLGIQGCRAIERDEISRCAQPLASRLRLAAALEWMGLSPLWAMRGIAVEIREVASAVLARPARTSFA